MRAAAWAGCLTAIIVSLWLSTGASLRPATPPAPLRFQKGVNFTAERRVGYGAESVSGMLDRLAGHGVDSIAVVPYGFAPRGEPVVRFGGGWERDADMERLSAEARRRGMLVLLKPQIWLRRGYPGEIEFDSEEDRARWFAEYARFLEHYAKLATRIEADLFSIGVEFARMTRHESEWRSLIALARRHYNGPLTYTAAHGPEFESVRFWDALDYIGLSNYYPLSDGLSADRAVRAVEAVYRRYRKPVLFTEAGFASLKDPHLAPWDETPREWSGEDQARCYEAVFRAFYDKPWFQGVYWWKVGTNGYGGPEDGSHTPWGKPAMDVVARWYTQGGR
ncbi:MAG: hypothetical protein IPM24_12645 [Bryobacterales bacterium]|nr:hypothetical protein [Bryobacterales bacterium]